MEDTRTRLHALQAQLAAPTPPPLPGQTHIPVEPPPSTEDTHE